MSAYNTYGTSYSSFTTMGAETMPAAEKVRRHPKYYLNGGDIHFLVENYIFRVHRYFFERESSVFREKLNIPPAPGQNPKGTSDSNPIPLDDVREVDFARFLWVFYNPKYSIYDANVEEWSSILKLSYDWRFPEVKRLASRFLETFEIDPVQKIELYQWYELDRRLLLPSYMALINRQEPLSIQEGRRLTLETSLLLATARECARGKPMDSGKHSPTVASVPRESMVEIIKEVFGLGHTTPTSPSLGPIWEGSGPSAFSATPMSPSKIITSPPRDVPRDGAMSPTPNGRSKKHSHSNSNGSSHSGSNSNSQQRQPSLPQPEMLAPEPNTLLPGQSPTKPEMPSVPPYLTNLFNPPTPPATIKASKSTDSTKETKDPKEPKGSKKAKESEAKDGPANVPAGPSAAAAGNTAGKSGQSVTRPQPPMQHQNPPQRQQAPPPTLAPLEIPGNQETPMARRNPTQQQQQQRQPSSPRPMPRQQPITSPQTPIRTTPQTPAPQRQSAVSGLGSALGGWLRGAKATKPETNDEPRSRKDSSEKRFFSPGYHTNNVTNAPGGAGTVSHEFHDTKLKSHVQWDSVSNAPTKPMTNMTANIPPPTDPSRTQGSLSDRAPYQSQRAAPSTTSLTDAGAESRKRDSSAASNVITHNSPSPARPDSAASRPANRVSDPANVIDHAAAASGRAASSNAPPAARGHAVGPPQANAAPPAAYNSANAPPQPNPASDGPSGTSSGSGANAQAEDAGDAASKPKSDNDQKHDSIPPADEGWVFDGEEERSDASSADGKLFKDAVVVNAAGDSDDDKPLALLANKPQDITSESSAAAKDAASETKDKKDGDKQEDEVKNVDADPAAQSAEVKGKAKAKTNVQDATTSEATSQPESQSTPQPDAGSSSDTKEEQSQGAGQGRAKTGASEAAPVAPTATSAATGESSSANGASDAGPESNAAPGAKDAAAAPEAEAKLQSSEDKEGSGTKPPEGPDASVAAATATDDKDKAQAKVEGDETKDDPKAQDKPDEAPKDDDGAKKPALHVDTSGAGEGASSLPKHLQPEAEGGGDSAVMTESEAPSGQPSPVVARKPKKKKKATAKP